VRPERIAGRYRVERAAGHGGMGTVWLCADELLGRQVAVKQVGTLPGEPTPDLARALREARSLAALNHRNVVSVYDAVEEDDQIWLVMEYVPGRTLSELLAQERTLSPQQTARIGAQAADGLAAAHARGTVHRDVKPGNILVSGDGVAKISDFGISRTEGDPQVTRAGLVIGTPAYFSPELARGEAPTPAADVWALGATLYLAVEGRPLFPERDNSLALLADIASRPPRQPHRAGFLTEAITRSLDPDPRSRWDMVDLAHVLHRLSQRHDLSHTRPVTAAFSAGLAPGTPPGQTRPVAVPHPEAPGDDSGQEFVAAEPPGRGRGGGLFVVGLAALVVLAAVGGFLLLRDLNDGSADEDLARPTAATPEAAGGTATGAPTETTTPSPDDPPPPAQSPAAADPVPTSDAEQFVASYYAALPDDVDAGWSSLSPDMHEQIGYDSYRGFWNTIRTVTVTNTEPAGNGAVDVSLAYTRQDGTTASEVRRIAVERSGSGYQIVADRTLD
jgi:hypothetical protein